MNSGGYWDGTPLENEPLLALGISVFSIVIAVLVYLVIIRKAGYSGWWVLTMLVPVLNMVMVLIFACSKWPVVRELEAAKYAIDQQMQEQSSNRFSWGG